MDSERLVIVVIGGSGDLARKKIYPALFALHCQDRLPADFRIVGFARSPMDDTAFRDRIIEFLTCRYTPTPTQCARKMQDFLTRCHYQAGDYGAANSYLDLFTRLQSLGQAGANTLFYMAIPPSVFMSAAKALSDCGMVRCCETPYWTRVVVEKPFGRDRESSDGLAASMARVVPERQTFRIDHYLGKEVVQNLLALRFANAIFEPIWNCQFVERVEVTWKEDIGTQGRGGYFDEYGILRDVVQNHLLQVLAMAAMEKPSSLSSTAIRDCKVAVLEAIPPVTLADVLLGQYTRGLRRDGRPEPGYLEDATVPTGSITPTFAAVRLHIHNPRWQGVPFLIRAGKAASERRTTVRLVFRSPAHSLFCPAGACPPANELVIRIQPDEGLHLQVITKVPGEKGKFHPRDLDLSYRVAFSGSEIPDAYESLLLDVIQGDRSLFIRNDELAAAWDIFTPLLQTIDRGHVAPIPYAFGDDRLYDQPVGMAVPS